MIKWRAGSPSATRLEGLKVYTYISDEVAGRLASATRLERVNILAYSCLLLFLSSVLPSSPLYSVCNECTIGIDNCIVSRCNF